MNHKLLELTPDDFEPFVKKKRPEKLHWFHFNLNDQAFFDADVVIFREDGKVTIMKDRYGTNDPIRLQENPWIAGKR